MEESRIKLLCQKHFSVRSFTYACSRQREKVRLAMEETSDDGPHDKNTVSASASVCEPGVTGPAWRAHTAMFCAVAGAFCNLYAVQPLVLELKHRFGMDVTYAASLLTVTTLALAISSPAAGRVGARYGAKRAVLAALGLLACLTAAIGFATDGSWLVIFRLLQGCLIPVAMSPLLANTRALWPDAAGAALAATYTSGVIVGGLGGRFLPAALMPWGWETAFSCFAAVQLLLAGGVLWLFPIQSAPEVVAPGRMLDWLQRLWLIVRKEIPAAAIGGFVLMVTQAAITSYAAVRLAGDPFNWSTRALGTLYVVFVPALLAVRLTPRAIAYLGTVRTLAVAAGISWAAMIPTLFDSESLILAGLTVFSACVFVAQTVLAHIVGSTTPASRDGASVGYITAYYLGVSAGAIAPSLVWTDFGWLGCLALVLVTQAGGLVLALKAHQWSRVVVVK